MVWLHQDDIHEPLREHAAHATASLSLHRIDVQHLSRHTVHIGLYLPVLLQLPVVFRLVTH